ncbi:MAG: prepilin-type N-terminal cleavage/methylation domain-containing protein [Undibacterium sp.]|nr:prepilin-type N-terminal cleavage/methylation domain-containing protein [Opitutaceae bacterium]
MTPARRVRRAPAFSLIELLVVIAIVAILFSLTFGLVRGSRQRAALARAKAELSTLVQALEAYKLHYGDYPQTGALQQAAAVIAGDVASTQAQSVLFNALTGVFSPKQFTAAARLNGPVFIDFQKLSLEPTVNYRNNITLVAIAAGSPPLKPVITTSFLDPWGNRYLYYYKISLPAGIAVANPWRAPAYVLYSAGPDGLQTPPTALTGLYTGTTQTTGTNADNLYADKLP